MKKSNLYFYVTFKRTNGIKLFILNLFLALCSWPRLFLEVFIRKNFGERYFLLYTSICAAIWLALLPRLFTNWGASITDIIGDNITWYAYLGAFLYFSVKRHFETVREPGVFDFAKFSLSPGIIHPWFRNLTIFGNNPSTRVIATILEPGVFLIAGGLLALLKQEIGYLLMGSSIIYSISWAAQYHLGDQFIMDKIDEGICNEEFANTFVDGLPPEETRGFEVYGDKPRNREFRRKVAESIIDEEPAADVF
ncbi:hypothetical protein [Hufsiella ginkgonis]|uniref:Uncharacterized protein n=1 Tax=Hufsiella ginkgonis TaxID=2695274 RepID=A0A7K1Y0Z2_9SPHI|nr:hypothetical protein [Hufsiella ginkgonis]MXV16901.1 hypothetical protein [Hufsiella ginkgonis]